MLNRRAASGAAFTLVLVLAGAGCSDDESVFNQEAGECVESVSDLGGQISELPESDCAQPHEGEIGGIFTHTGDTFPGQTEIGDEAFEGCVDVFRDYVGVDLVASTLDLFPITPTQESWDEIDDRESICVIVAQDSGRLEGTVADRGDDFTADIAAEFADLTTSCLGGDEGACDELYNTSPVDSVEERIGASCGGRDMAFSTVGACAGAAG